ncbi:methyltransferase family protein [Candidatus Entotheonella palauensis]|uniref:Isoprenylcysteine carboxyl methyltransferase n=1 Tax=Candidatus Entotheonella gemina TaxID=1429439 RepID=W4L866_9BACT|nr:isoprenylcysteine carboxylmethyltransferase family protein [Candidatus Entotheonella palauensis]ETW93546.1 MAG: hypothetical protein ETSY2_51265 [Candidatus Entotheonella gemina]
MLGLKWLPAAPLLPAPWHWIIGGLLFLAGTRCTGLDAQLFRKAGTNLVPFSESTTLVTHGLYRYTRNPMYLGLVIALAGIAFMLNERWPWLVLPVFAAVIQWRFIRFEERLMETTFGDDYLAYQRRVRRWL